MSRLIARILLTIFMLPAAVLVYILTLVVLDRHTGSEMYGFLAAGFCAWSFLALYWLLLWKNAIVWNGRRILLTSLGAAAAIMLGTIVGAGTRLFLGYPLNDGFGTFIATMCAPIAWLIITVFVWRETPAERGQRLGSTNRSAIVCPTCGYNLTGLTATRCPECGSQFTLDELLASQSKDADLSATD